MSLQQHIQRIISEEIENIDLSNMVRKEVYNAVRRMVRCEVRRNNLLSAESFEDNSRIRKARD